MYKIVFYETYDGKCPIWDFMEDLRLRSKSNKNARIQFKQISTYIELLRQSTLKKIFGNLDQETIEYSIFIIKKILLFYFIPKKISKNTKARN
jgi:hypothetical protein